MLLAVYCPNLMLLGASVCGSLNLSGLTALRSLTMQFTAPTQVASLPTQLTRLEFSIKDQRTLNSVSSQLYGLHSLVELCVVRRGREAGISTGPPFPFCLLDLPPSLTRAGFIHGLELLPPLHPDVDFLMDLPPLELLVCVDCRLDVPTMEAVAGQCHLLLSRAVQSCAELCRAVQSCAELCYAFCFT
jgi:hypothetical protein